jgi:tetratricopeptide (TPR) repeat protein
VAKALQYGVQIVRGLEAAQSKGIFHCDLKSENLFVTTDGQMKILDFGIATLSQVRLPAGRKREHSEQHDTHPGGLLGTPGYLAPEQVRGLPADARSDLFSLGVVLYEMLSGRRPFQGATAGETISKILNEDAPELEPLVPAALQYIVSRCLEKRPEDRFDSAHDVALALDACKARRIPVSVIEGTAVGEDTVKKSSWTKPTWWWPAVFPAGLLAVVAIAALLRIEPLRAAPPDFVPNRIAVVPFENGTADSSLDWLGRNAAARIQEALGQLNDVEEAVLLESARTSVAESTLRDAAATTGAALVVTGAYTLRGDHLGLTASIHDARERRTLRTFHPAAVPRIDPQEAVQTLCDRLMVVVQDHLHPCMMFGGSDRIPRIDAYLEIRRGVEGGGTASSEEMVLHLMRAVELDPEFVRPRLFLGGLLTFTDDGIVDPQNAASQIERVLPTESDRLTVSQYRILSAIRYRVDGNWLGAWRVFDEELRRGPDTFPLRVYVIDSAVRANRPLRAIEVFRGLRWDPIQPPQPWAIAATKAGTAYHLLGQYEQELAAVTTGDITRVVKKQPLWTRTIELRAIAAMGQIDRLNASLSEALVERPYWPSRPGEMLLEIAEELRAHGFHEDSTRLADRALEWFRVSGLVAAGDPRAISGCGRALSLLGRPDAAYDFVLESFENRPHSVEVWASIGIAAAKLGDRDTTLEIDARLADVDEPFDHGQATYHRVRMATQLGEIEGALHLLRKAIVEGFGDYARLHRDPNLDPLRSHPGFQSIMRPKG